MKSVRRAVALAIGLLFAREARAEGEPTTRERVVSEFAVSMGATALLSPAIYSGARVVGTSSSHLATSALPAFLMALVLPPAVATATIVLHRRRDGAPARFVPTYFYALGAQAIVLMSAFAAKAWVADPTDLILLSAATGGALGGAATLGTEIHF